MPIPVIVTATHSCYARECRADGVLFSGGRFAIDYPFRWFVNGELSGDDASGDASLNITGLVQTDGKALPGGWRDIGLIDLTEQDEQALQDRITSLQMTSFDPALAETVNSVVGLFQRFAKRAIEARSKPSTEAQ